MRRSTERILTTHAGSLPRPDDLRALILKKQQGEAIDEAAFAARVKSAVGEIVRRQSEAGIDIVADGEMGRVGFIPYVNERLAGIEPSAAARPPITGALSREYQAFPEFYAWAAQMPGTAGQTGRTRWVCTGPVSYKGLAALQQRHRHSEGRARRARPCRSLHAGGVARQPRQLEPQRALQQRGGIPLRAGRRARARNTSAIIDAGLVLQVDDPLLASYYVMHPEASVEDCRNWATTRVDALNHALRGLPAGPHPLSHLLQHQYRAARPRHGAEAHRRHHAAGQCRRLFVRGRQPAPRARMAGVGGRQTARGQVADPRRHHPFLEHRRAPRS